MLHGDNFLSGWNIMDKYLAKLSLLFHLSTPVLNAVLAIELSKSLCLKEPMLVSAVVFSTGTKMTAVISWQKDWNI